MGHWRVIDESQLILSSLTAVIAILYPMVVTRFTTPGIGCVIIPVALFYDLGIGEMFLRYSQERELITGG